MKDIKYKNITILNLIIVITAVICYSPGLLCLRPDDEGIFRAGMSILIMIALVFAFFYGNYTLLSPPKRERVTKESVSDIEKAAALLKTYFDSRYYGNIAKTTSNQLQRMRKSFNTLETLLDEKFDRGSLSYNKYYSVIETAQDSALSNIILMANRMQVFNEADYARLEKYKDDDIPDDIQEQQIALYDANTNKIKESIAVNEKLLLKIDTLLLELSSSGVDESEDDTLLEEIEQLTKEVKLYS